MSKVVIGRRELLRHRFVRQGLAVEPGSLGSVVDVTVLDLGIQDTGPDGHGWALAIRGAPTDLTTSGDDLVLAWTLRGAPHAYRRSDLDVVAVATAPFSEAVAVKRIFDAAKPLKAAGIEVIDALRQVAEAQRSLVTGRMVKGDLSSALTSRMAEPFRRFCRPCGAIHLYEQSFRLAALQAGLVLEPGTSPPVLSRLEGVEPSFFYRLGTEAEPRVDVVRDVLRFSPGSTMRDATAVIDGAARDVKARWPEDAMPLEVVDVAGTGARFVLAEDAEVLGDEAPMDDRTVRLLGPFDLYLQLRDRELLVPDEAHRKDLWRTLGRPGAVVADGEIIGTWRPRSEGKAFSMEIDPWITLSKADHARVEVEAERLAAFRGKPLKAVTTVH